MGAAVVPRPASSAPHTLAEPPPAIASPANAPARAPHPDLKRNVAIVGVESASSASNFVAMAVRTQPEAGPRSQIRADVAELAKAEFDATPEGDFWHAIVSQLIASDAVAALTRELALQSQLMGRDAELWSLRVESEALGQGGTRDKLQAALAAAGHAVRLAMEIGPVRDSPARRNTAALQQRQKAAEAIILADPFVQEMMQNYGAKIVPGSLRAV